MGKEGPNAYGQGGGNESVDELGISAVEIQDSLRLELGTLFTFGSDFPGPLRETLQRYAQLTGEEFSEITKATLEELEDESRSGFVLSQKDRERALRKRIGEEMVSKMSDYLYRHEIPHGDHHIYEDTADRFITAARALLTK
jgi:hypothetical protein